MRNKPEEKDERVSCLCCGGRFKAISNSHALTHGMTRGDYIKKFDLCAGETTCRETAMKSSASILPRIAAGSITPFKKGQMLKRTSSLSAKQRKAIALRASRLGHEKRLEFWSNKTPLERSVLQSRNMKTGWANKSKSTRRKHIKRIIAARDSWRNNNPKEYLESQRKSGERMKKFNLAKTHCPRSHPYSGENLIVKKDGSRKCKTCEYARNKIWRDKLKATASGASPRPRQPALSEPPQPHQ
jgi:hypothetical protein